MTPPPLSTQPGWPQPSVRSRLMGRMATVRRAVLARRRLLAALCAALATFISLRLVSPEPEPTVQVLVAARDLPSGTELSAGDLHPVAFRPESVPSGVADRAIGRTLATALRRGEPVTDVRLVGRNLTLGHPGLVAAPIRLPDSDTVALLRVGDQIDLMSATNRGAEADVVAYGIPVLALPEVAASTSAGRGSNAPGRLAVVGVTSEQAAKIAQTSVNGFLTFAFSD